MNTALRVLTIEDNQDDAELLVLELEKGGYAVHYERVDTANALHTALERQYWDVILADYSMPQFNALAALAIVQSKALDIPFIIVSGSIGEETAVAAMREGSHDYLLKNNLTRLVPAVERELREAQVRRERRQALEDVETLAFYDPLTGLPNRTKFLKDLQALMDNEPAAPENFFSVVFLDIDRYKRVKYGFGHLKGDQFLIEVARRLQHWLQPDEYLTRAEGDSFALVLRQLHSREQLQDRIHQLHHLMKQPFQVEQSWIYSSASIGVVDSTINYASAEELLRAADTAVHNAQQQGSQTVFFNAQMQTEELERLQLESDLQQALQQQQLQLHYQPLISFTTGRVVGFEALVRWRSPMQGWVSPSTFIPLAEQTGLIIPLGEWVLTEACRQMHQWHQDLADFLPLSVAVNLSGIQLTQANLAHTVQTIWQQFQLDGLQLKLEITESVLMTNADTNIQLLEQLQADGIQICIDDFGTGYSSLAYLHCLPIDTLKVDRSFVNQMTQDPKNFDIVKTIITLAHTLDLNIVAEGVETKEQLGLLRSLACDEGQGYFFSKPLPPEQVCLWMQTYNQVMVQ